MRFSLFNLFNSFTLVNSFTLPRHSSMIIRNKCFDDEIFYLKNFQQTTNKGKQRVESTSEDIDQGRSQNPAELEGSGGDQVGVGRQTV